MLELQQLRSEPCVFKEKNLFVVGHADDLVIFGCSTANIGTFRDQMRRFFMIKNLGKPAQFPGIELTWMPDKTVDFRH